ncbi:hypothetical protein BH23CHL4_BH23CHL4_28040 [soil metagenome]
MQGLGVAGFRREMGDARRDVDHVAGSAIHDVLGLLAPPHPALTANDINGGFVSLSEGYGWFSGSSVT